MPRSIYQRIDREAIKRGEIDPPFDWGTPRGNIQQHPGWDYTGHDVYREQNDMFTDKAPVWNWADGAWILLNADIDKVDYDIRRIEFNKALLVIHDHLNFDYLDYRLTITGPGVNRTVTLPDDARSYWITGLTQNSTYTTNLQVRFIFGGWSPDSIQTFKTPLDPTPKAITNLTSPRRTNSWIDLKWSHPRGSSAVKTTVYYGYAGERGRWNRMSTRYVRTVTGTSTRITGLREDRRYWYYVRGQNQNGKEGPWSNQLKWATGHSEIRRKGRDRNLLWTPAETGSYRLDLGWRWSRPWGIEPRNPNLYHGWWPGNNWYGRATPQRSDYARRTRNYWGVITYNAGAMRAAIDRKHGANVGWNLNVNSMRFIRFYRHRGAGDLPGQPIRWHLTNSNPFNSGQPPTYGEWSGARLRVGTYINNYWLPPSWGTALLRNRSGRTYVNGLVMNEYRNYYNAYGGGGYAAYSGHRQPDQASWFRRSDRYSDLRLKIDGSWNFVVRSYKGPWRW